MDKYDTKPENQDVHIEQIDPHTELNDLEKTAILQFEFDRDQELSKTKQFKILNQKKEIGSEDLPKLNLSDTIKIKLSDLREAIDLKNEIELPKKKKSLYDTVVIKLDDLINKKNALTKYQIKKVTDVYEPKIEAKQFHLFKPRDITKLNDFKLNVDSEEFGRQLYNLNKIALANLSNGNSKKVRRYNGLTKLNSIEKIHVSKTNYLQYQKKLSKFAINKLYYKFAPKETSKYKIYKYSVIASCCVFAFTSLIIVNWFIQGASTSSLSNSLIEDTDINYVTDGTLMGSEGNKDNTNVTKPEIKPVNPKPKPDRTTMYWKYLNTPLSSVNFNDLLKQNKDTVGWLIVNNTNVNYPVVQTTNNDYYLSHSFDRKKNSAGWVYADFRNDFNDLSKNTVIYAHGRKDKVMFGSLTNTLKEKWYKNKDNQIIQLSTPKYNTMWQIVSIYKIRVESYYITTDFSSEESYSKFLNTMKERSIYDFNVPLSTDDKLLTLSTCYNDNGIRLVVQAKLVKMQKR